MVHSSGILIIEDDTLLNKSICDRFKDGGFKVKTALDGETGWELLQKDPSSIHILLCDLMLPKMTGVQLISQARRHPDLQTLRIIVMSGVYRNKKHVQLLTRRFKIEGYWLKPFNMDELIQTISDKNLPATRHMPAVRQFSTGHLAQTPIEKVFLEAYHIAFTGVLLLQQTAPPNQRRIYFSNGFPVYVESNAIMETLGHSLVKFRFIDEQDRERASKTMVVERKPFGQTLLAMNLLSKSDLFEGLRRHSQRLLINTFTWKEGLYYFEEKKELPSYILHIEFNPIALMLSAYQDQHSEDFFLSFFQQKKKQYPAKTKEFFELLPLFDFNRKITEFLRILSGQMNMEMVVAEILREGENVLLPALYLMVNLDLIHLQLSPAPDNLKDQLQYNLSDPLQQEENEDLSEAQATELKTQYLDFLDKDYFEILHVQRNSQEKTILESFRILRSQFHPKRYGPLKRSTYRILEDIQRRLYRAQAILTDPHLRSRYIDHIDQKRQQVYEDSKKFYEAADLSNQGRQYLIQKNYELAANHFKKAHELWPKETEYLLYFHFSKFKQALHTQQQDKAHSIMEILLPLCASLPLSETAHLLAGHLYYDLGHLEKSKEELRQVLRINYACDEAADLLRIMAKKEYQKLLIQDRQKRQKRIVLVGSFVIFILIFISLLLYFI